MTKDCAKALPVALGCLLVLLLAAQGGVATALEQPNITHIEVSGDPQAYSFEVTVESPDTGCQQYVNWWEVLDAAGNLLYRRILAHSHVDEQPFTRGGGPVEIKADEIVMVRAHLHPSGYGTQALQGNVSNGFESVELAADFRAELAEQDPLPEDCAW